MDFFITFPGLVIAVMGVFIFIVLKDIHDELGGIRAALERANEIASPGTPPSSHAATMPLAQPAEGES